MGDSNARNIVEQLLDKINYVTCASSWGLYTRTPDKILLVVALFCTQRMEW